VTDPNQARRERLAAADHLLETLDERGQALEELASELRRGRQARARVRDRVEDFGGHEADTLFGTWLDSDDRIADRLEHLIELQRSSAEATRAHIAATELLLFELDPARDDPRADA
jgi:hypothetical protein